jgi:hypothetical protein
MSRSNNSKTPRSWVRDLLTGLYAWLLGFILYVIPGIVVAISMGLDLGPKLRNSAEVGRLISKAISEMYQSSLYLHYAYVLVLAGLVLWRSRATSETSILKSTLHGALVSTFPVILIAIPFATGGHFLVCVTASLLVLSAGIIGARWKSPSQPSHSSRVP